MAEEEAKDEEVYIHPELVDISQDLDDDELSEIAKTVTDDFEADENSRSEWLDMHEQWTKLYFQMDKPMNPPWEGASDESMPMLVESCHQFSARAYQALFPNRNFLRAMPLGKVDAESKERAKRVQTHMAWQLTVKDKKYKRNKDRLLAATPLHGSVFTKTYYCPVRNRNVVENVRAVDLVVPYGVGPRDIEDLPRKTQILRFSEEKARLYYNAKFFNQMPKLTSDTKETPVDEANSEAEGLQSSSEEGTCVILEQHRYLDLDDDGHDEPYIVWVDLTSKKVLRIAIRYDVNEVGDPVEGKEPVEYYEHYCFLENPDGFYGLGLGHLIGPLNSAVNKLVRQSIDAGTLANVGNQSGFVSQSLAAGKGDLQMHLGKFTTVPMSSEDISKGIFQFKFPGPQPVLLQIAQVLMARSDRLGMATEAITGQTDKVMQPTTVMALIEQSMKIYSSVYERLIESWEGELDKLYHLNRKHLDPQEYFTALDIRGEIQSMSATREDYAEDFQIKPIADPKMTTDEQKLSKAQAELQFAMSNPLIVNSPQHLYNASRRYLDAIGVEDIGEILPNPSTAQMRIDDPMAENMGLTQDMPVMAPAYPDQNHDAHLQAHMAFKNDHGAALTSLGLQMLDDHIHAHQAMKVSNGSSQGPAGLGAMGAPAGNPALAAANGGSTSPQLEGSELLGAALPAQGPG